MKKNSGKNFEKIQVNPIDGEYYITIPEWIMNEFSWYEDTEIQFDVESDELIIREHKDD